MIFKNSYLLALVAFAFIGVLPAAVTSTSGNIYFDIDDGGYTEMTLGKNGLGIGANLVPSANLHVSGNSILTGSLVVGSSVPSSSNLYVSGVISKSADPVGISGNMGDHSIVLAESSLGNLLLRLPEASDHDGLIFQVKKTSLENHVDVIGGGKVDGELGVRLTSGSLGHVEVISASGNWFILNLSGNGGFWSPGSLAATTAWYDASDTSTIDESSGAVNQLDDKSGNNHHLVQGTTNRQPTTGSNTINGLNVLTFVGSGGSPDGLTVAANLANLDFLAIVTRYSGSARLAQVVGHETSANGENYTIQYRGDVNADRWQNSYYTNGSDTLTNIGASAIYSTAIVVRTSSLTNFPLTIGVDRYLNNRSWDGVVAEVVCGSGALDASTKDRIEGYLAWKWGLEDNLPSDHPYKSAIP